MGEVAAVGGPRIRPAVQAIATEALARGVGVALPTNADLLVTHGLGAGTLQRALYALADSGALETVSRGRLGRFITSIDLAQCWHLATLAPVRVLLPPGGPPEIEALTEELAEQCSRVGVPYTVHHLRGGAGRVAAVRDGAHDLAVVSSAAWATMDRTLPSRRLPSGTYYASGQLVLVTRRDDDVAPTRVGIDRESPDHIAFTRSYFSDQDVELVDVPFPDIPAAVLRGAIDIGVWHSTPSVIPLDLAGLSADPVDPRAFAAAWDEASAAVLVASLRRPELRAVLDRFDEDAIVRAQATRLLA